MRSGLAYWFRTGAIFFTFVFAAAASAQQQGAASPGTAAPTASSAGLASQQSVSSASATPSNASAQTAPKKAQMEVISGTHIPLVLHNAISTRSAKPGDPVYFETIFPVMVDGHVVIPAGSYVSGEITASKRPGRIKGRGEMTMKLTEMILPNGYMVNLNAMPNGAGTGGGETVNKEGQIIGDSDKTSDVGTVIRSTEAGTGIGAGLGAAAGNIGKGVGIGAGIGAVAGLGAVLLTRGPDTELPRGSTLEAVIERPIYLDADKVQFTGPGQASALAGPPNREPQRNRIPF
jgi:type IV secretion system protein VirB10